MKRLIGLIGWLGVALVLAAVALRFLRPELQPWHQRLALAGLIVTAIYALTQWRDIARTFQGRNVRYGSFAATGVVLVLGILVAINWISSRENKRWDVTGAGQFTLSDQTKKVLSSLKKPVTIRVFYVTGPNAPSIQEYRDRLGEYAYISSFVKTDFVDAERNPTAAQTAGVTTVPTFVIEYDGRTEKANSPDEQTLTNALKKVIEGKAKKIYFLQGHGERDPTASDKDGYSGVAEALKGDNFDVAKLDLAMQAKVPDDASVIVIAGPTKDLLPAEATALTDYLKKGGKLLITLDPPDKGTAADPASIIALAHDWGIAVGRDVVIDVSAMGQQVGTGPMMPLAKPADQSHPITATMNSYTAFPLVRSVTPIQGGANGHTAQALVESSAQSWAETDLATLYSGKGKVERNLDKGDKAGPVSLAAAVSAPATDAPASSDPSAPKPESRLVVVGDSDFAANATLRFSANQDFYLNIADWLAQQEDLIAIHPKDAQQRLIAMTADQQQLIFWFTMVIMPLLLFGNGIRVWWRRR